MRNGDFTRLAQGRDNNCNLIRMVAASSVIVSHSYGIQRGNWVEPLSRFGFTLGGVAVTVFFALSGFLVMKSFERRHSLAAFGIARALRVFPALAVVALVTAFAIGPAITSRPLLDYLMDPKTLLYVPRVLSLRWADAPLPGVFDTLPSHTVNGPLWTLWYEVVCYAGLGIAGTVGLLTGRRFILALGLYAVAYLALFLIGRGSAYAWLSLPFVVGMAVYRWRERIPASLAVAAALALVAAIATGAGVLGAEARLIAIAYAALWAAQADSPMLRSYNEVGDYSYGVYIYGWPIQQMIVTAAPDIHPLALAWLAVPIAIALGAASWYTIERPALQRKRAASEAVRRIWLKRAQWS